MCARLTRDLFAIGKFLYGYAVEFSRKTANINVRAVDIMTVYGIISIALEAGIKIFFAVLYVSVGPSLHVVINQPFFLLLSLIATQH